MLLFLRFPSKTKQRYPQNTRAQVVQLLLDHGADANALDKIGMTPMDISVKTGNRSIRKVLEASGVELQSALEQKARESSWLLKSSDFKLRKELGNTLKSVVHLADWNGTTVVVKCIKMKHRVVMKKLRKSQSLCLSLDNDELEAGLGQGLNRTMASFWDAKRIFVELNPSFHFSEEIS